MSRRVWDILMLLPTNPAIHEGFTTSMSSEESTYKSLLDPASPQKLMYSLYIVEALVKMSPVKSKEVRSR
jgi:ubiquitin carboxyl-terminal hydrolase 34